MTEAPKLAIGRRAKRKPVNLGNNARKRAIPSKRKTRVRLRAHLEGRLTGRPLTAHERSWL